MKTQRTPLRGKIWSILIIFLFLITLSAAICLKSEGDNLKTINDSLNITLQEKDTVIESLKTENSNLVDQISQLQKENEQRTTIQNQSTATNSTNLGQFKITAYCNCSKCCGKWAGGPTASGTTPTAGRTIAVDPKVIPLGTKVIIDGHTYIAEDTGSAIKGKKIDMYFASHSEAMAWGVKHKNVSIVK